MVAITCPWCEEGTLSACADAEENEGSFTCADCGTSVALIEEATVPFDLAA